MEIMKEKSVE